MSISNTGMDSIPTKATSSKCKNPCSWITSYIKRLTHRKQRAYISHSNLSTDWSKYYDIKRQCQREHVSNLVNPDKNSVTKRLWSFIKSKRQDHIGISTLKYQGETFVDATDKANVFADYFSSVFISEDITHIPTLSKEPLPLLSISLIQIHLDGVYQLLQNIQQHKASDDFLKR